MTYKTVFFGIATAALGTTVLAQATRPASLYHPSKPNGFKMQHPFLTQPKNPLLYLRDEGPKSFHFMEIPVTPPSSSQGLLLTKQAQNIRIRLASASKGHP
jgi:hypothetical protein